MRGRKEKIMIIKCPNCGNDLGAPKAGVYRCGCCGKRMTDDDLGPVKKGAAASGGSGADVFEKNKNGILEITCRFPGCASAGSGLLIDRSGYCITNTHVVTNNSKPCNDITVKIAGENIRARIIALGDDRGGHGNGVDLAMIKLERLPMNAKVIELGDFDKVRIGESVYVVGNSLGYGTCITSGIVSDKRRNVNGHMLMMTDCAVNGGNSGGPIFNAKGVAIGVIVSGITAAEGMNFAIPMDTVQDFISKCGRYR